MTLLGSAGAGAKLPTVTLADFEQAATGEPWPGWGLPFGVAATTVETTVHQDDGRGRVGRLAYRDAAGTVMLPLPDQLLLGRPTALTIEVNGDASGNLLSLNLIDAEDEWFRLPGLRLDWRGWRAVRLNVGSDLEPGLAPGNRRLDYPLAVLSLNLTFDRQATGEIAVDNLHVEQVALPGIEFLGLGLVGAAGGLVLPEDPPPGLSVENRSPATVAAELTWRLPGASGGEELLLGPGQRQRVPLRTSEPGRQTLTVELKGDSALRLAELAVAVLPARLGDHDTLTGLGSFDPSDLTAGRFTDALPLLRAIGCGWTVLTVDEPPTASSASRQEWTQLRRLTAVAWAQDLELVIRLGGRRGPGPADQPPAWQTGPEASAIAAISDALAEALPRRPRGWWLAEPGSGGPAEMSSHIAAARLLAGRLGPDTALGLLLPQPVDNLPHTRLIGLADRWTAGGAEDAPTELAYLRGLGAGGPHYCWSDGSSTPAGNDPAATLARQLTCGRLAPGLVGLGWASVTDRLRSDQPSPELTAYAVNCRLLGGLTVTGLERLPGGAWAAGFSGPGGEVRVVWRDAGQQRVRQRGGEVALDHLGRPVTGGVEPLVGTTPVYLVTRAR